MYTQKDQAAPNSDAWSKDKQIANNARIITGMLYSTDARLALHRQAV